MVHTVVLYPGVSPTSQLEVVVPPSLWKFSSPKFPERYHKTYHTEGAFITIQSSSSTTYQETFKVTSLIVYKFVNFLSAFSSKY